MTDRIDEIRRLLAEATPIMPITNAQIEARDNGGPIYIDDAPLSLLALANAAPELLGWAVAEIERGRNVRRSLRDWAQGRVETLTRCIAIKGVDSRAESEMMYERTIMRDIVAMLDEVPK